jgi:flagellar biosynthesis protein FlhG
MVVSIISGKGGVGKSAITINLAERAASIGLRTLAIDLNSSGGNLHLMANASPQHGVDQYLKGSISLETAVVSIAPMFDLLGRIESGPLTALSEAVSQRSFVEIVRADAGEHDLVLIDHASGMSEISTTIAAHSDCSLLVVNPELTSIADCYGLFKYLSEKNHHSDNRILINRVKSAEDAEYLGLRLTEMAQSFLRRTPQITGAIFEDNTISQALSAQQTVAAFAPQSIALQQIERIAQALSVEITVRRETPDGHVTPQTTINNTPATADIEG